MNSLKTHCFEPTIAQGSNYTGIIDWDNGNSFYATKYSLAFNSLTFVLIGSGVMFEKSK